MYIPKADIEAQLATFVVIEDEGQPTGWSIRDDVARGDEIVPRGSHKDGKAAMDAALAYLYRHRPDLIVQARAEAEDGIRYRRARQ